MLMNFFSGEHDNGVIQVHVSQRHTHPSQIRTSKIINICPIIQGEFPAVYFQLVFVSGANQ
jgi:hypothetical protein